jgi:hypothetical protein
MVRDAFHPSISAYTLLYSWDFRFSANIVNKNIMFLYQANKKLWLFRSSVCCSPQVSANKLLVTCIVKEGLPSYNESSIILELLIPVCILGVLV